jgi:hypothetical protein
VRWHKVVWKVANAIIYASMTDRGVEDASFPKEIVGGTIYTSRFWKWLDKVQNSRVYKEYGKYIPVTGEISTNLRFNIEPTNKGEKSSAKVLLIKKERKVFVTGFIRFFYVGPRLFLSFGIDRTKSKDFFCFSFNNRFLRFVFLLLFNIHTTYKK